MGSDKVNAALRDRKHNRGIEHCFKAHNVFKI